MSKIFKDSAGAIQFVGEAMPRAASGVESLRAQLASVQAERDAALKPCVMCLNYHSMNRYLTKRLAEHEPWINDDPVFKSALMGPTDAQAELASSLERERRLRVELQVRTIFQPHCYDLPEGYGDRNRRSAFNRGYEFGWRGLPMSQAYTVEWMRDANEQGYHRGAFDARKAIDETLSPTQEADAGGAKTLDDRSGKEESHGRR